MSEDLSQTDLLAKTDSFAVKTLTNNRPEIEELIKDNHLLNASNSRLLPDEKAFLEQGVSEMKKEIAEKTGGAFDLKDNVKPEITPRPRVMSSFETDSVAERQVANVSNEEAPFNFSKDVKEPNIETTPNTPAVESAPKILGTNIVEMNGKEFKVTFARSADGQMYIPEGTTTEWGNSLSLAERQNALEKYLKPNYFQKISEGVSKNGGTVQTSFNPVFERFARAESLLGTENFQPGTAKYIALENYVADRKEELTKRFGDIFKDSMNAKPEAPTESIPEIKIAKPEVVIPEPEVVPSPEKASLMKEVMNGGGEDPVYEINSEEIKGQIKFVKNENGGIDKLQYSKDFVIKDEPEWKELLGDNWKKDLEDIELKNPDGSIVRKSEVKSEMEELVRLRMFKKIKQDAILSDSPENRFMIFRIKQLEAKYKPIFERFK